MTDSRSLRSVLVLALALALAGWFVPSPSAAAEDDAGDTVVAEGGDARLEEGEALYRKYCGACHGLAGEGDGVVSGLMRPAPTDLTVAAKRHGGDYPFKQVMNNIDGTNTVRAHGDPDMPVWGEILSDPTHGNGQRRADVQGREFLIVKYLESIQKK